MVAVAQLVEHRVVVADVAGSSPVSHPRKAPAAAGAFFVRPGFVRLGLVRPA